MQGMFYRERARGARWSVKFPMKSNMFEVTGESVLMLYGAHLTGTPASSLLVIAEKPLSNEALTALRKSARTLEFGDAPVAVATLTAGEGPSDDGSPGGGLPDTPSPDESTLGPEDVRTIVEGLDPVALVATDAASAEALSAAYRTPVTLDAPNRLLGRTAVIFQDFESLMETPESKQKAWALLKQLR